MKALKKDETLTKHFLRQNIDELDFYNTIDIGKGSKGIIKIDLFSGSFGSRRSRHKYLGSEYYLVEIVNDNYTNGLHRFTCEVVQVIQGDSKMVGDKFTKRGKNLYGNYHELVSASIETLENKHDRGSTSKSLNRIY